MTEAWGYVRISQEGRDTSIDKQKQSVREYCTDHDELELVTTLNDGKNTSGFDTDREGYQTLVEKIDTGEIGAVVVRDRARLARDFDERLRLITAFRETGIEWHVVEAGQRIKLEAVQTAAMECVHAAMGHAKKMAEIKRAKAAISERMDNDYDHGRPKFGMEYDDAGHYQVPGDRFDDVLEVLNLRASGASFSKIAARTGISKSTVQNIVDRREWYEQRAVEAGWLDGEQAAEVDSR